MVKGGVTLDRGQRRSLFQSLSVSRQKVCLAGSQPPAVVLRSLSVFRVTCFTQTNNINDPGNDIMKPLSSSSVNTHWGLH